jgi:CHAT domain
MAASYENFELRFERTTIGYKASVDTPAGQAQNEFAAPFSEAEVDAFFKQVGEALNQAREITLSAPGSSVSLGVFQKLGEKLFNTVFSGEVRDLLERTLGLLEKEGKHVRLRLHLNGVPELAQLPWEYLYHRDFLALSAETPIVRYLDVPQTIKPLSVKPPLKILVVIAGPSDYPKLNVEAEWEQLQKALSELSSRGLVALKRLAKPTVDDLQQELRREDYHIFHFIGHGDFDPGTRAGTLLFEDEQGQGRKVPSQVLKILLHDETTLRLAILNACKGARTSKQDPLLGMAQGLVTAGLPAVIAMQFAISDAGAIAFARSLYQALADNVPLESALSEARKTMFANQPPNTLAEWGTPVLFMRAEEGTLLELAYSEALSGLASLTELARTSPEVQRAVVSYRNDFTTARKDIDVLGNYKDLHDQLHQLQYNCYSLIVSKIRSVTTPASGAVADELRSDDALLENSEVTLLNLIENIRRIIGKGSFANYDTAWLSYLEQAHEALGQTLLTWDISNLKRVRSYLDRVLNIQPSKINAELEFTARNLNLPQVVKDMTALRDNLSLLKLESKTVMQFASGVEALMRLDERLASLLRQHAAWQTIDTYLRTLLDSGIKTRLETDPDLFKDDWRELIQGKAAGLSKDVADGLSGRLNDYATKIEEAMTQRNAALLERQLELYRRCVGLRFFRVDADLKTACDELRKVGEPLDALLGMLEVVT